MDYNEALRQKDLILQQIEELGQQMSGIQQFIDSFKDRIKNLSNYVGKFVKICGHHYMYITEVSSNNDSCVFKGLQIDATGSYVILDNTLKEYRLPIKNLEKDVVEISKVEYLEVLSKATVEFLKILSSYIDK